MRLNKKLVCLGLLFTLFTLTFSDEKINGEVSMGISFDSIDPMVGDGKEFLTPIVESELIFSKHFSSKFKLSQTIRENEDKASDRKSISQFIPKIQYPIGKIMTGIEWNYAEINFAFKRITSSGIVPQLKFPINNKWNFFTALTFQDEMLSTANPVGLQQEKYTELYLKPSWKINKELTLEPGFAYSVYRRYRLNHEDYLKGTEISFSPKLTYIINSSSKIYYEFRYNLKNNEFLNNDYQESTLRNELGYWKSFTNTLAYSIIGRLDIKDNDYSNDSKKEVNRYSKFSLHHKF